MVADGLGTPEGMGGAIDIVGSGEIEGSGDGAGCAETIWEPTPTMTIAVAIRPANHVFTVLPPGLNSRNQRKFGAIVVFVPISGPVQP